MKFVIVLFALVVIATAVDVYPTKYDTIDIDEILRNKRLSDNYFRCLLKQGTCTEEGALLRDVIPDALLTECRKCNEHQRESVEKVIRFLIRERKNDWDELIRVYDPRGEYQEQYKKYLDKL